LGPVNVAQVFDRAEPALVSALAAATELSARARIAAAEATLGLNALAPERMAEVYRGTPLTGAASAAAIRARALSSVAAAKAETRAGSARSKTCATLTGPNSSRNR